MSVAGFDVGDNASCVAVCGKRGVQVLLNKESNRESPSIVSFGSKIRLIGTDAAPALSLNPKNTVGQLKRLLGRKYNDAKLQQELRKFPFKVVQGPSGKAAVEVQYMDAARVFLPEQLLAMIYVDLKSIMEKEMGERIQDVVISCPAYFTEGERQAVLTAASIAEVNCLRLLNETTATAVSYAIFHHGELFDNKPFRVMFVDFGHQALQVSVVALLKGQVQVLSHSWDRDLGGRDFELVLVDYFTQEFLEKYKLDVRTNGRSLHRLHMACEKVKKVLSANKEATLNVECLMNDIDFNSHITREAFEKLCAPLIARVRLPLERALKASGLSVEQLNTIEIVGGTCRLPAVTFVLTEFLGREPSRTLHSKEVVSEGCAWQCALLSGKFRINEVDVVDSSPYNVEASWSSSTGGQVNTMLFPTGSSVPSSKALLCSAPSECVLKLSYAMDAPLPGGYDRSIGSITLGPTQRNGYRLPVFKVIVDLSLNSTVYVEGATQVEGTGLKATDCVVRGADVDTKERGVPAPFQLVTAGTYSPQEVQAMKLTEAKLAAEAREQEEANECRNAVESLMFSLRSKMGGEHGAAMSEVERNRLTEVLDGTETWLYDEGEDQPKSVYQVKLATLNQLNDALEHRLKMARGEQSPRTPGGGQAAMNGVPPIPSSQPQPPASPRPTAAPPATPTYTHRTQPPPQTQIPTSPISPRPAMHPAYQTAAPQPSPSTPSTQPSSVPVATPITPTGVHTPGATSAPPTGGPMASGGPMLARPGSMAAMKAAAMAAKATAAVPPASPLSHTQSTTSSVTREPSIASVQSDASGPTPGPSVSGPNVTAPEAAGNGPQTAGATVAKGTTPPSPRAPVQPPVGVAPGPAPTVPAVAPPTTVPGAPVPQAPTSPRTTPLSPRTGIPGPGTASATPAGMERQPSESSVQSASAKAQEPEDGRGVPMNSLRTNSMSSKASVSSGSFNVQPTAAQQVPVMPQAAAATPGVYPVGSQPVGQAGLHQGMVGMHAGQPGMNAMPAAVPSHGMNAMPAAVPSHGMNAMPAAVAPHGMQQAPGMPQAHMNAMPAVVPSHGMPQAPGAMAMSAGMAIPAGYAPVMMNGQPHLVPAAHLAAVQMHMMRVSAAQVGGMQPQMGGPQGSVGAMPAGYVAGQPGWPGMAMPNQMMMPGAGVPTFQGGYAGHPGLAAAYPGVGAWPLQPGAGVPVAQGVGAFGGMPGMMPPPTAQQLAQQGQPGQANLPDPWASI